MAAIKTVKVTIKLVDVNYIDLIDCILQNIVYFKINYFIRIKSIVIFNLFIIIFITVIIFWMHVVMGNSVKSLNINNPCLYSGSKTVLI